jgi:hypothetical protein
MHCSNDKYVVILLHGFNVVEGVNGLGLVKGLLDMGDGRMEHVTPTFQYLVGIVGCGNNQFKVMLVWNKCCSLSVM